MGAGGVLRMISRIDLIREGANEDSKYVQAAGSYIAESKKKSYNQLRGCS